MRQLIVFLLVGITLNTFNFSQVFSSINTLNSLKEPIFLHLISDPYTLYPYDEDIIDFPDYPEPDESKEYIVAAL